MRIPENSLISVLLLLVLVAGCATGQYASAISGVTSLGEMRVTIGEGWLRVPDADTPEKRSMSRVLSRENVARDRLMLISGVSEGESIFRSSSNESPLPSFEASMSIEQIAELVSQSMQQSLWSGNTTVTATNIRGHGFTGIPGFLFELDIEMPGGQHHKGVAGGFVDEQRLYVNIFAAEYPSPYEQYLSDAQQVIESAVLRVKTIKMSALMSAEGL